MQCQEAFISRVKRQFYSYIRPDTGYNEDGGDDSVFQETLAVCKRHFDKLPFNNPEDAGARLETYLLALPEQRKELPGLPAGSKQQSQRERAVALRREELREAAWLAAGRHGFAALAGLPELQQLLLYSALPLIEHCINVEAAVHHCDDDKAAANLQLLATQQDSPLLVHLAPALQVCLLAEVLVGLLVPGQPLPPDTPEHGTVLQAAVLRGCREAIQEAVDDSNEYMGERWGSVVQRCNEMLNASTDLQLALPGHELLELLCQLMDEAAASDGAGSSSSSLQLAALRQLVWQWRSSMTLCRQLQQQRQQSGSSSSGPAASRDATAKVIQSLCAQACSEVVALLLSEDSVPPNPGHDSVNTGQPKLAPASPAAVAAEVLESAAAAQRLWREGKQQRQQRRQQRWPLELKHDWTKHEQSLPAEALAEQLRVLGGGLVLQFVAAARAAGGPAWQQEVPLQAVVLFGALEQLQGLALVAVKQQDVQHGAQVARAAAAAAAAAAAEQQRGEADNAGAAPGSQRKRIVVDMEESSSEEPEDEEQQQQEQQQQQELQQQQSLQHPDQQQQLDQQAPPAACLLQLVHKLLDLIHLTRQFAQLNAALNSSSTGGGETASSSSSSSSASKAASSSSSSRVRRPMSCEELFSAGGPVHTLYPEPCTLSAWAHPEAAGSSSAAAAADSSSVGTDVPPAAAAASTSNGSRKQQPMQTEQQLLSTALAGALLLFGAHYCAHRTVFSSSFGQQLLEDASIFQWQCSDNYLRHAWGSSTLCSIAERIYRDVQDRGIKVFETPKQLLPAICFGHERLEQLRQRLGVQLQRLGVNPGWTTLHDAGSAAADSSSDSGSSNDSPDISCDMLRCSNGSQGMSSSWSGWLGTWQGQQQQQQQQQGESELASAIRAGGQGIRALAEIWSARQHKPAVAFLERWLQEAKQRQRAASDWWYGAHGRSDWMGMQQQQQQQQQQAEQPLRVAEASSGIFGTMNRWLSRTAQWATISSQQEAHSSGDSNSQADGGCPLCQQEKQEHAAAAGAAPADAGDVDDSSAAAHPLGHAGGTATASGSACSPQQAWRDPCMWRRLVWGLLGRVKPVAQAWYVQHYAMCPHCPCPRLWAAVTRSLLRHLWVPPDTDPLLWQLAVPHGAPHGDELQGRRLLQYARALNTTFLDERAHHAERAAGSNEAALLSHQVLLSLSPLQHQLQPASEVAPLCPSSFGPAVNKLLMQQLGMAQLLQQSVRKAGQPQLWHVWWHIGIRRYHWVKQQQQDLEDAEGPQAAPVCSRCRQQEPQQQSAAGAASKSSKARMKQRARKQAVRVAARQVGLQPLSAEQLGQLYADPAARYYAAGFAARQTAAYGTGLRARDALRAPHMAAFSQVSQMLQEGRTQQLLVELDWELTDPSKLKWYANVLDQLVGRHLQMAEQEGVLGLPAFPPLFRPEGQVGSIASLQPGELHLVSQLRNRSGEALDLLKLGDCAQLVGYTAQQWWQRHQRVTQRCDTCMTPLGDQQQQQGGAGHGRGGSWHTCPSCCVPFYCSPECQMKDQPHHALLCPHLLAARQRYGPGSSSPNPCGRPAGMQQCGGAAGGPSCHRWRVLDLLLPEPGPLGMYCQALG